MKILEEEPPLSSECKLPWLIDAFLYPTSVSGMIHIAVFVLLPRLVGLVVSLLFLVLYPIMREGTGYFIAILTFPFYIVFYGYVFYYIAYCVIDSTKGNRRAPDIPIHDIFNFWDLISQIILLLGCVAICMWPAGLYYGLIRWDLAQRDDRLLWLLIATGVFFLPMSLLRGVLFDSFDALNPIELVLGIVRTFVAYLGLVLFFLALPALYMVVVMRLAYLRFLADAVWFYLIFVLVHRLGWFYWWHKDKLDWGI